MLGKLMKYELKETARLLIPLNLILIAITFLGAILLGIGLLQNDALILLSVTCMMFYILCIFALFVITGVFLTIRFYKTMYSDQGYLTHTLPVKTASLVNSKILISMFWIFIAYIISMLSILLLVWITAGNAWSPDDFFKLIAELKAEFGVGFYQYIIMIVAMMVLTCIQLILMLFSSLSVGQLFRQHRILASVGTFVVFYILQQIAGVMLLLLLGLQSIGKLGENNTVLLNPTGFYQSMLLSGMAISFVFSIGYFIACHYITGKYLNLE